MALSKWTFVFSSVLLLEASSAVGQEVKPIAIYDPDEYEALSVAIDSLVCWYPLYPGSTIAIDQFSKCSGCEFDQFGNPGHALLERFLKDYNDSTVEQLCLEINRKCAEQSYWVLSFRLRKPYVWTSHAEYLSWQGRPSDPIIVIASRVAFDKSRLYAFCTVTYHFGSRSGGSSFVLLRNEGDKWKIVQAQQVLVE